jgi:hypothetical protein
VLYEDNQGTIYMSRSVGAFNRSKHIDTRVFRLRELVESGILYLQKVATAHNLADVFTKSLGGPLLQDRSFYGNSSEFCTSIFSRGMGMQSQLVSFLVSVRSCVVCGHARAGVTEYGQFGLRRF